MVSLVVRDVGLRGLHFFLLFFYNGQVLILVDQILFGLESQGWTTSLQLELVFTTGSLRSSLLVEVTTIHFVHSSHYKLKNVGSKVFDTHRSLSDWVSDELIEEHDYFNGDQANIRICME